MSDVDDSGLQPKTAGGVIFVTDDDDTDRLLSSQTVIDAMLPYSCRLFRSGEELMDALLDVMRGAPAPIVCFIDVKMGGMSGLDVLRWIRAQSALHEIPVVMLSSSDESQHLAEALQLGAQCYAAKFPGPKQLREILTAAEGYCAAASCSVAFQLPCNLLLGSRLSA